MDVCRTGLGGKSAEDGKDGRLGFLSMGELIARVEGGQLYRNPRRGPKAPARGGRDSIERVAIGVGIVGRVSVGLRRLTEHVEAVADPLGLLGSRPSQRLVDRPAEHKLPAKDLHPLPHRGADDRLAKSPYGPPKARAPALGAVVRPVEHLAGEQ